MIARIRIAGIELGNKGHKKIKAETGAHYWLNKDQEVALHVPVIMGQEYEIDFNVSKYKMGNKDVESKWIQTMKPIDIPMPDQEFDAIPPAEMTEERTEGHVFDQIPPETVSIPQSRSKPPKNELWMARMSAVKGSVELAKSYTDIMIAKKEHEKMTLAECKAFIEAERKFWMNKIMLDITGEIQEF